MSKPLITLSAYWLRRAEDFATTVVEGYRLGRKDFSRRLTVPGKPAIWGNAAVQLTGRLGEIAWCEYLGLDANTALDWSAWCDHGADFTIGKHAIDVKTTNHAHGSRLIWPVSKNDYWNKKAFTALALARVETGDDVRLLGIVSKTRFAKECVTSDGGDRLVPGTRFMHAERLCPPHDFKEMVRAETQKVSDHASAV